MPSFSVISFNAPAMSKACWRLSIWQGPAMSESLPLLENATLPAETMEFWDILEGLKCDGSALPWCLVHDQAGATLFDWNIVADEQRFNCRQITNAKHESLQAQTALHC